MIQKAPGAYQTISEVSVQLDVPAHVLRFWESKFTALKPMKRSGGRRYYRSEDIKLLQTIKSLLYDEGYTIKGAQNTLKKRNPGPTASQPDKAVWPVTAAQASATDVYLDKAETMLKEANKQVVRLLGQLGR